MTDQTPDRSEKGRPAVEWIFGWVSAAVVCGLVSFLGYEALSGDARPPDLIVAVERVEQLRDGTLVAVAVVNRGDEAASAVTVYASIPDGPETVLRKQIELDYVAAHAVRRGAFVFRGDVSAGDVALEIGGYAEP